MLGNKKDEIKKSKKGKESIIGKIIYGFLLFMPLLAITSAILVNTFNNQAKDEVNIVYKYETNELNSLDDLVEGNIYHYKQRSNNIQGNFNGYIVNWNYFSPTIDDTNIDEIYVQNELIDNNLNYSFRLTFYGDNGAYFAVWYPNNETYIALESDFDTEVGFLEFDFIFKNYEFFTSQDWNESLNLMITPSTYNEIERVEQKNITNVFYEAIDDVENSPLFNWSKNSELYTVIHNTCNILDLTNTFIPMLMTYWVIISIIYVIYDIALIALHVVHRKIHELQDSI